MIKPVSVSDKIFTVFCCFVEKKGILHNILSHKLFGKKFLFG